MEATFNISAQKDSTDIQDSQYFSKKTRFKIKIKQIFTIIKTLSACPLNFYHTLWINQQVESIVIQQKPSHPHLSKIRCFKFLSKLRKVRKITKSKMRRLMKRKLSKEAHSLLTCLQSGTESKTIYSNKKSTKIKLWLEEMMPFRAGTYITIMCRVMIHSKKLYS